MNSYISDMLARIRGRYCMVLRNRQAYKDNGLHLEELLSEARANSYLMAIQDVLAVEDELYKSDPESLKKMRKERELSQESSASMSKMPKLMLTNSIYGKAAEAFLGGRYTEGEGFQPLERSSAYPKFTLTEVIKGCKNVGVDLKCGRCSEIFFTGSSHDPKCPHFDAVKVPTERDFAKKISPLPPCSHPECRNGICVRCYHDENFRETSGRLAPAVDCTCGTPNCVDRDRVLGHAGDDVDREGADTMSDAIKRGEK